MFHYQVSFVVDDIKHDDDDSNGDKVWHEMTRCRGIFAASDSRWRRRSDSCSLLLRTESIMVCKAHTKLAAKWATYSIHLKQLRTALN